MTHSTRNLAFVSIVLLWCFTVSSCSSPAENQQEESLSELRIGISSEPDALNPITYKTINARVLNSLIFQKLLEVDFSSLDLVPVLASSKPQIESTGDSLYTLTYQIREEATWDDGRPITAADVLFTMKLGVMPGIGNEGKKDYLSCIRDIITVDGNRRKIIFKCSPSMRMEYATGAELGILPAHHYDPDSLIQQYSFKELAENKLDSLERLDIQNWAEQFNQAHFQRMPGGVNGSGPYKLVDWTANQHIKLDQKEDFWGRNLEADHPYFEHHASRISYFVLTESAAMIASARNGQIDIGPVPSSALFVQLKSDSSFLEQFQLLLAPELSTNVIILNACTPKLNSVKTRKALAHLFDTEAYIETVQKSTGKRITGPLHPSKTAYNRELQPYPYNLNKAKALLEEDGWKDSDGNGILDKNIAGQFVELSLEYKYNTDNEGRKNAGLMFKEWARPAGVEITVSNEEWMVFIESLMGKDFEMAFFSWNDEHAPTDPTTLYHSTAIDDGYNFGCFQNSEADSLMEVMAITVDSEKRRAIWFRLQEILHDRVATLFLSTNSSRYFVSRKFKSIPASALEPGYWAGSIQLENTP